jgi:putative transposase
MPRKSKTTPTQLVTLPKISSKVLDELVPGPMTPGDIEDVMRDFKKALIERSLGAEMNHHLGYSSGATKPSETRNHRNGTSGKTVLTGDAALRIDVPRDREGSFEPQLIAKHERRFTGFDDKIITMYARGMTVR